MNINTQRCREYADMFAKLADGTHTIEESISSDAGWQTPTRETILVPLNEAASFQHRHRIIKKPCLPETVTVYVYKDKNDLLFVSDNSELENNGCGNKLIRTSVLYLHDDTAPVDTAIPTPSNGIDWSALPEDSKWTLVDENGDLRRCADKPGTANGIDWSALPDTANWAAMDEDGEWWWFGAEPCRKWGRVWSNGSSDCDRFVAPTFDGHWAQSLQQRPRS
jgi:hypothetical protein